MSRKMESLHIGRLTGGSDCTEIDWLGPEPDFQPRPAHPGGQESLPQFRAEESNPLTQHISRNANARLSNRNVLMYLAAKPASSRPTQIQSQAELAWRQYSFSLASTQPMIAVPAAY